MRRIFKRLARGLVYVVVAVLTFAGGVLATVETSWGKNQIRRLIVRQANQYLTASLDIGELNGSLLRGLELRDVRLSRGGTGIIAIESVALSYSIRELVDQGTTIRRIRLVRPQIVAKKESDGRWNLSALVRQNARDRDRRGPSRPIAIESIEVENGSVVFKDPLVVGGAHVPSRFERLNLSLGFSYVPVRWRVDIVRASWLGGASDLAMDGLSGSIASGPDGVALDNLIIKTSQSALTVAGRVNRGGQPANLDLHVVADRFLFQEWASVLPALSRFPIDSRFDAQLRGPLAHLATTIDFTSNAGKAAGTVTLDTTVPGWKGSGALDLEHLDLAPWFNNPNRKSDVTGKATFDLALQLGRGIPQGPYRFTGPHASYGGYEADRVDVAGTITDRDWKIATGSAVAYGANVSLSAGTITMVDPVAFRFVGHAANVDLRRVPPQVPVPHVESLLALDYDVMGQFIRPFLTGSARFDDSVFLDAHVASGTTGFIDTSVIPVHYSGDGDISNIRLSRFGTGLDVAWMRDPRYEGTIAGHFRVDGAGFEAPTMTLNADGEISDADVFEGRLSRGQVTLGIDAGSLQGSYDGRFEHINPAIPFADEQWAASLTGSGSMTIRAPQLLVKTLELSDYSIAADATFESSEARGIQIDKGAVVASIEQGVLHLESFEATGPLIDGTASGDLGLEEGSESRLAYHIRRGDLELVKTALGDVAGILTADGTVAGPWTALRFEGNASVSDIRTPRMTALSASGDYAVTIDANNPATAAGSVTGSTTFVNVFGRTIQQASGTVAYDNSKVSADVQLVESTGLNGAVRTEIFLRPDGHSLEINNGTLTLGGLDWRMLPSTPPPLVSWNDRGVTLSAATLVTGTNTDQRVDLGGVWQPAGGGSFRVRATNVFLDSLSSAIGEPATYGGVLNAEATLTGSENQPIVTGQGAITNGRIQRLTYEQLAGKVDYRSGMLDVDVRLDQAPNVWLTFTGSLPPTLFSATAPERPVDLKVESSDISLGLLEGLTTQVSAVTGQLRTSLQVVGTSRNPILSGPIELTGVGFQVSSTGARYRNGSASLLLSRDLIDVKAFHLEDRNGSVLSVTGALGTEELRVGEFQIDIVARKFEVLRNELGTVQVDANLGLRGDLDAPRLFGDVAIVGGQINTDDILSRALNQPYATQPIANTSDDTIAAINPWNRLSLDVVVHSQNALRMIGDNITVSPSAPVGLGSFDLRASGDIYLYKEPQETLSITGSLDSISGSYSFQGRRFDLYPSSSVDFRGDLNPSLFISVFRTISGVETRVTISGTLQNPELQLSSTPPLDQADIMSLIVFNASANELSLEQQRELAVRAGALAVGFLTSSLSTALQRSTGIDILEVEPITGVSGGARITIGDEIAPGLVARFSRQFGTDQYDEATLEYYLSRLLRIRATFSDANSAVLRSPFRRVERAGIDFLIIFSF